MAAVMSCEIRSRHLPASAPNVLAYVGLAVTVLLLAAVVPSIAAVIRGYID